MLSEIKERGSYGFHPVRRFGSRQTAYGRGAPSRCDRHHGCCVLVAGGVGLTSVVAPDSAFTVEKADASDGESGQADPVQSESASLFVHVGGSVADPGLYELDGDARVQQAIDAAGGFAEDAAIDALNLARQVQDGEQIIVPGMQQATDSGTPVPADSGASAVSSGGAFAHGKVDINTATVDQLQQLNGVGPA